MHGKLGRGGKGGHQNHVKKKKKKQNPITVSSFHEYHHTFPFSIKLQPISYKPRAFCVYPSPYCHFIPLSPFPTFLFTPSLNSIKYQQTSTFMYSILILIPRVTFKFQTYPVYLIYAYTEFGKNKIKRCMYILSLFRDFRNSKRA